MAKSSKTKSVATLTHDEASRVHIPTAEYEAVLEDKHRKPVQVAYRRRNQDLDPQLVWRGKDVLDWSDLVVQAPPLFIQEKVHPKVLVDDLIRRSREVTAEGTEDESGLQPNLFAYFNGLPREADRTEFYQHDSNWSNRMILGDSLQVMASLAEREGLRGKVQCIYVDPPYGIRFNSNWQWSTTSRAVKDGQKSHITREPEQVKAYRDTWREGIHSYLTYLRDRLTVARDLLSDTGSLFVQIGDENVHRVRSLMDEIYGSEQFMSLISFRTKIPLNAAHLPNIADFLIWYAKDKRRVKYRRLFTARQVRGNKQFSKALLKSGKVVNAAHIAEAEVGSVRYFSLMDLMASGYTESCHFPFYLDGRRAFPNPTTSWKTTPQGMSRLLRSERIRWMRTVPRYAFYSDDYPVLQITNQWVDTQGATGKSYVVQTATKVVERCLLMTTDPGDLVLDPTCGAGTTAYVAEQWGRRWVTIDTSRVALALARARVMGARYPYYLLSDSPEGQLRQAEMSRTEPSLATTFYDLRQGFVYRRVPHITLGSIANNGEIDVIWERCRKRLDPLREQLNLTLKETWEEWA